MKAAAHTSVKSSVASSVLHIPAPSSNDAAVQTCKNLKCYRSVAIQTVITSRPEVKQEVEQPPLCKLTSPNLCSQTPVRSLSDDSESNHDSDSDLDSIPTDVELYYAPTSSSSSAESMDSDKEVDVSINKEKKTLSF